MSCRFYGKFPFCRQCWNDKEMCEYYYKNMTYDERNQFYAECQDEELKRKVKEMLED